MPSWPRTDSEAKLPLPPLELADRVGHASGEAGSLEPFVVIGAAVKGAIEEILPHGWSWSGKRVLDFGCGPGRVLRHFAEEAAEAEFVGCDIDAPSIAWARENLSPPFEFFVNGEAPPLAQASAGFDLVFAFSVFTHIADEWSGWLVELHRILAEDGLLVVSVLGGGLSEAFAGEPWDPDRIGMNVLQRSKPWSEGGPTVLISEWWLRARWGRIFHVVRYQPAPRAGEQDLVLLRRRPAKATRAELERPEPGEPRELAALAHNVRQLHHEAAVLRALLVRSRVELEELRGSSLGRLSAPLRAAARRLRSRAR